MNQAARQKISEARSKWWASLSQAERTAQCRKISEGQRGREKNGKAKFVTIRVPTKAMKTISKSPKMSKLLGLQEKASKPAVEPKITRKHMKVMQKAIMNDGKAFFRFAARSGQVRFVSPKFYAVTLKYPMNRPTHPIHTRAAA